MEVITVSPFSIAAAMDPGSCIPCFIPQSNVAAPLVPGVYTHCMRRIAAFVLLCVFGTLLPTATVVALAAPQKLIPVCCRAHGAHSCVMAVSTASTDAGPTLRQPGCPFGPSLRGFTSVAISADFSSRINLGLVAGRNGQLFLTDVVTTRVLRRSAPRGPPSSFLL